MCVLTVHRDDHAVIPSHNDRYSAFFNTPTLIIHVRYVSGRNDVDDINVADPPDPAALARMFCFSKHMILAPRHLQYISQCAIYEILIYLPAVTA